jgi:hypothetical protein
MTSRMKTEAIIAGVVCSSVDTGSKQFAGSVTRNLIWHFGGLMAGCLSEQQEEHLPGALSIADLQQLHPQFFLTHCKGAICEAAMYWRWRFLR